MADYSRCISALKKAAGRDLTDDEIIKTLERIQSTARDLRSGKLKDPGGPQNLASEDGLMMRAAQLEAEKLTAEAERKAANAVRDAKTIATRQGEMGAMSGLGGVERVKRLLVNTPDGQANNFSLETRYQGISTNLKRKVQDTWLAMDKNLLDYLQRRDKTITLLKEIKGEDTGDAVAKKGAKAWLESAEEARKWFNDLGGKIGHLEDWGVPQHYSQEVVARKGVDAFVDFYLPRLDRARYVDLGGKPMTDAEVTSFLKSAWKTIATNGVLKNEPGKFKGAGARGNRHAEERQIHLKDAQSLVDSWAMFGEKTFPDILLGHLDSMAKDIAFVEHFGSNPDASYRMLRDTAMQKEVDSKQNDAKAQDKVHGEVAKLDRLYDYASGKSMPVVDRGIARGFDVVRDLNTAGKLGSAAWASLIGDKVLFEAMGHINNLPALKRWRNEVRLLNPANAAERRQLRRQALMLDYMTQAMYRFGDELGKSSWAGKLANGVMKISGMSAVNEWRRGAWALTAMDTLGHVVKTNDFANIGPDDMRLLTSYGISERDWRIWKLAKLDDLGHGNSDALTPDAVGAITDQQLRDANLIGQEESGDEARRDATVKLLGALNSESHLAVLEPGWESRARMYSGLQRGNVRDELTRSFWQFKAFPINQFERIWQIGLSRPTLGGKIGFMAFMPVMLTMAGAMQIQVQEMLAGKDPRPMNDWKFWAAAFLKGGTLGIYGDFLFSQDGTTRYGTGPLEAVAGPTIGGVADIVSFGAKVRGDMLNEGLTAEEATAKAGAKALGIAKGYIPGQNLWYTKAATDHFIFQALQEMLSPGYLDSMRARTERDYGSDWWWSPGPGFPDRPPDLGNVVAAP